MLLQVTADDRTGALEVAAALADRGAGGGDGVPVSVWPALIDAPVAVVDLGSRHLTADAATDRAAQLVVDGPAAHKIDSTLRGNWAAELVARQRTSGRRVLLVPALPELGRVCVDGVVLVDGRPVHEGAAGDDPRAVVASSRPVEMLAASGASGASGASITSLTTIDAVVGWLSEPDAPEFGVADAADTATVEAIVALWLEHCDDVLLAGTSSVIAAALGPNPGREPRTLAVPCLVVAGSLHPSTRAQLDAAVEAGAERATDARSARRAIEFGRCVVLSSDEPLGPVDHFGAEQVVAELAEVADAVVGASPRLRAVMVLGGDTAAAVLGEGTAWVQGTVGQGTAWVDSPALRVPVITRAGGFGDRGALVELLWGTLPS